MNVNAHILMPSQIYLGFYAFRSLFVCEYRYLIDWAFVGGKGSNN